VKIDCTQCEMYRSDACDDCLVTAVLHPPAGALELDDDVEPTVGAFADAGLIPVLRFRPRAPATGDDPDAAAETA